MDRTGIENALKMARRSLSILETQIAGFGELNVPPHIQLQYDLQKEKVAEYEAKLAALSSGGSSGAGKGN